MAQHEKTKLNTFGVDTHLNFGIDSGGIYQILLVGVDYKWTKEDKQFWRDRSGNYDIDWRNPQYQKIDESGQTLSTDQLQKSDQVGVYIQDQIEWNNWNLLASTRYDWVEVRTTDRTISDRSQQNDGKLTGLVGLLYSHLIMVFLLILVTARLLSLILQPTEDPRVSRLTLKQQNKRKWVLSI
ncbi:TonB-dependent receptor domain-containing protein [Morganella morganii]|uniref:TonB-dependent receptor domain-containing protein n=1 Tax=Morganella morganii TaxID=582 RepID=UPI001FFCB10E|nr:TonB-dependent receptor [Morganella morganii]